MIRFIYNYHIATSFQYSASYVVFRDRVVNGNGTISTATKAQQALDYLDSHKSSSFVQWLDARFGVSLNRWYSIVGESGDALRSIYGNATLGTDIVLGTPVYVNGAWNGGNTPQLNSSGDNYTIGLRYFIPANSKPEFFWGNRYGSESGWNYLTPNIWRSYNSGSDTVISLALPFDVWQWIWLVKQGGNVSIYDQNNTLLGSTTLYSGIVPLPIGIMGGTDSTGISTGVRYQTFIRAASALTAAQRAAIQMI
jgi:hypothetical protein